MAEMCKMNGQSIDKKATRRSARISSRCGTVIRATRNITNVLETYSYFVGGNAAIIDTFTQYLNTIPKSLIE